MDKLQEKAESPDRGLYLHVPFCARTCDFCPFYQEAPRKADLLRYLEGMERSLLSAPCDPPAATAFWGGGTPGLLPLEALERLGRAMLAANGGQAPAEWTVEMAPATVQKDRLRLLRDLGVNRISMGVQTFQPAILEALGRIHSLKQVRRSIELLHHEGFRPFNLDLMFAVPGQTLGQWESDLAEALAAEPDHLSTYCLTFEEDTALWVRLQEGQVERRSLEEEAAFHETAEAVLGEGGFQQYEISNYCRPGQACHHNINTWRMREWRGHGPSAASQWGGYRWSEPASLERWLARLESGSPPEERIRLDPALLAQDCLVFGLRMNEGVDLERLEQRFGPVLPGDWPVFRGRLVEEGLAEQAGPVIRLTGRGRLVADRIGAEILALG